MDGVLLVAVWLISIAQDISCVRVLEEWAVLEIKTHPK
jgi:hypothetical protein